MLPMSTEFEMESAFARKFIFIGFTDCAVNIENRNQCKAETDLISSLKVKFIHAKSMYVYFALAKLINDSKLEKVLLS